MAKISLTTIFTLALILTVISRRSEAIIDSKCSKVLQQTDCVILKCRSDCLQQYNGAGQCLGRNPYKCVCIYDCPPQNNMVNVPT
ncbi:hypothetical protein VNO78_06427 [Psophocarpus tetragonolobus]|uniref:Defensin-like protein n=1 Tax=Psophocarpus tetragonolobus TaxID=3891 RepID=A0AAN9T1K9_PSOTE